MIKIVGFKRSTGTFTNRETGDIRSYDNLNLFLIQRQNSDPLLHGFTVVTEKIKYDCAPAVLGCSEKDWDSLINKEVELLYTPGKYPRLEEVRVLEK